jgi:competence protein ComEA
VDRTSWLWTATASVAAVAAAVWFAGRTPQPPPPTVAVSTATAAGTLTVHVAGEVALPGLVEVPPGARLADAILAAGGALVTADLGAVNLAASLSDGQHIRIPSSVEGGSASGGGGDAVRVNTAGVEELQRLPGVGPVLAGRIRDHRDEYGPFGSVEDLLDVPGIGEAKLAALREAVLVP